MSWYTLSIFSLLFFGIQKFLFKVATENNSSLKLFTFWFMITVSLLSFLVFLLTGLDFDNLKNLFIIAIFNGIIFLFLNIFRFESLKLIPSTVAFPLFEFANVFVIAFSFIFFKEKLNNFQFVGIIIGLLVIFLLSKRYTVEKVKYRQFNKGLIFVFGAVMAAAISPVLSKIAANSHFNLLLFMAVSYLYNSVLIFIYDTLRFKKEKRVNLNMNDKSIFYGVLSGITNFIAFYTYLLALQTGTLSVISVITSFSNTLPILLSVIIYKDRLSVRRIIGIILTIIALLLVKA